MVEALLKVGSTSIGTKNAMGRTPIQIAAQSCQFQNLELLIKFVRSFDDPEKQHLVDSLWQTLDRTSETILHLACR